MEYPYGRIQKLSESLKQNGVNGERYDFIMKDGECIKQTFKNSEKSKWFIHAMKRMEATLDKKTREKIREGCACCLGGKRHKICKEIYNTCTTTNERIKAANEAKLVFGNGVREIKDGTYEVTFFKEEDERKVCPCLKDLDEAMPITYCYCCGGHVKYHLQTVLGKNLKLHVISSVLSSQGKQNCRFELTEI